MSRRYINQLTAQETVDQVFLASEKQLRPNRNGNLYLQLMLSDRTGSVNARLWNASEGLYKTFENGDYVRVEGTTQLFQGSIQMIATRITRVDPSEIDESDFTTMSTAEVDRLVVRIGEMLRGMDNLSLRNLAECFLLDNEFMEKFSRAPAGIKNHHAYHGGLLQHTYSLMDLAQRIAPCYPQIDRDLLLTGAFIHDIGKTDELNYERDLSYSDQGQMLGHLVLSVSILEAKVAEAEKLSGEPIDADTVMRLKHILISHHGEYEYGSPKLPMTLEAMALSQLDNLDAKIASFEQLIRDDPNVDSSWTGYHQNLGRKLYKGQV
ncbi:MAG: HD domain-containing protein [Pirellulales bacterium]|nr:HD domain-containing protein [Pirellulales bacterium]